MSEELYDYFDVDCEDCGHKFFVGNSYDYQATMAYKCAKCKRAAKEFNEAWDRGDYDDIRTQVATDFQAQ